MKRFVRQMVCLACLLLCGLLNRNADAMEEAVDTAAIGTLTVSYRYGTDSDTEKNLPLPGAVFRIYRVAAFDANGVFSLTSGFGASGVTDEQLNSIEHAQDWNALIETLVQYVGTSGSGNGTAVYQSAKTDENGAAVFSNLETGLYLLTVDDLTLDQTSYAGSPALVSVPSANEEGTAWEYDVAASVKPEATVETETESEPETSTKTTESTEATESTKTTGATESSENTSSTEPTQQATEGATTAETEESTETEASTEPEEMVETATERASDGTEAEASEAVQTGDDAHPGVWLAVLFGAFGVLILAAAWEIRRRGN